MSVIFTGPLDVFRSIRSRCPVSATSPQDFYRLSPSLIQQAIAATAAGQIDMDSPQSGLSYFSQPLLSWSLGGIVSWLCSEIIRNGCVPPNPISLFSTDGEIRNLSGLHLNVLQTLVLSANFPTALLRAVEPEIAKLLLPSSNLGPVFVSVAFDATSVQTRLNILRSISSSGDDSKSTTMVD